MLIMTKTGNVSSGRYSSPGKTGESTEVRQLVGVDRALEDLRLEAYWQRCLLATVILRQVGKVAEVEAMAEAAEARARSGAALGYGEKPRDWGKEIAKARAQVWDAEGLPWSALILAAVWDERCPLTCREMAEWIRGIGRRVTSVNALRATVKQLYGVGMLQRWPKGYALDPQVHAYFRERWGTRHGIEVRWGLVGTVVNDVGFDPKEADETTLVRMASEAAIPSTKMAAKAEIERRKDRGIWRAFGPPVTMRPVSSSPGGRVPEDEAPAKDWGVEKPREYGRVQEETDVPAAPALTANQLHMQKLREDREKMRVRLPARPADGSKIFSNEEGAMFMTMSPEFILNDLSAEQEEAFNAWTDKRIEEAADAEAGPVTAADGVSLYSGTHPDGSVIADDIARETIEETEGGCPNDPDDIDVIYPTEDEMAAIMRGEVVGPAAPEGFDTDPADEE